MTQRINKYRLQVAEDLYIFIEKEVLPGTGIASDDFWKGLDGLIYDFTPKNKELLAERERLQTEIEAWYAKNPGTIKDMSAYKKFLREIGYLLPDPGDVKITTKNVDTEISLQGGSQLVAPLTNVRFVINAANARWQSLYDALYVSDVISEDNGATRGNSYNPVRGEKVIEFSRNLLDEVIPLENGSHKNVKTYAIKDNKLFVTFLDGKTSGLKQSDLFIGYAGSVDSPKELLFKQNEMHIAIALDPNSPIAKQDLASVSDIILEAATTTIMDLEDAVAAVDSEDKIVAYRNWLCLMKNDLSMDLEQGGKTVKRSLRKDRKYSSVKGGEFTLHGRSMLFIRTAAILMTTPAILDKDGNEVQEGLMDTAIAALISLHGLKNRTNSREGSIYIVKPKLHGPAEAAFTGDTFARTEQILNLPKNTLKIGIMDEERRTSINLKACVNAVKERLVFINTGFLDRTGDEIRTSFKAGPMIRKGDMRNTKWIHAYEVNNVQVGLQCGLRGVAQIGKGMWAKPDLMADMLEQKIGHLEAGGNTAWVPSPTAAAIHAIHYHRIDVRKVQEQKEGKYVDVLDDLLTIPVTDNPNWSQEEIQQELELNSQSILGYVVRWVDQGIGCSKVPDIYNVALMEDRATLRISSLHIANWLYHGITNKEQVMNTLKRMAQVVDKQNVGDSAYINMAGNYENSDGFRAACDLVFKALEQPAGGYTEPTLNRWRTIAKS